MDASASGCVINVRARWYPTARIAHSLSLRTCVGSRSVFVPKPHFWTFDNLRQPSTRSPRAKVAGVNKMCELICKNAHIVKYTHIVRRSRWMLTETDEHGLVGAGRLSESRKSDWLGLRLWVRAQFGKRGSEP
eukprot:1190166-Prorocentrum_minimum.AAC.2